MQLKFCDGVVCRSQCVPLFADCLQTRVERREYTVVNEFERLSHRPTFTAASSAMTRG